MHVAKNILKSQKSSKSLFQWRVSNWPKLVIWKLNFHFPVLNLNRVPLISLVHPRSQHQIILFPTLVVNNPYSNVSLSRHHLYISNLVVPFSFHPKSSWKGRPYFFRPFCLNFSSLQSNKRIISLPPNPSAFRIALTIFLSRLP